ncbi:tRNA lysidine(34) synthetase TilS [Zavarzinia sp.]|uniref:tRNA lysidine(34) synthetase TilS n=1 Tax=Zavarzinia sp. TaxID=2027920 RepID=UPI003562B784
MPVPPSSPAPTANAKRPPAPEPAATARFTTALDRLAPPPRLALAVSGGADSLALLLLADAWSGLAPGRTLDILTVDHGFRPEAAAEAERVAALARRLGHGHTVLRPAAPLPRRGLEAAARAARYALLGDWCRRAGVTALLTGHSRDDQAETLLLRLQRGSGLDGLAAMAPASALPGLRLLRPLLDFSRAELTGLVEAAGWIPVADPMNEDARFARVAVRRAIATLGLDAAGLAATAARLQRDRAAIEAAAAEIACRAFTLDAWGVASIDRRALAGAPAPFVERALGRLIRAVGGGAYPPRRERLDRLAERLASTDEIFAGATLGGCRFLAGRERVTVLREARHLGPPLQLDAGASGVWDDRFAVEAGPHPITVTALGDRSAPGLPALRRVERLVTPAVFSNGELLAVPALEFGAPQAARLRYCAPDIFSARG